MAALSTKSFGETVSGEVRPPLLLDREDALAKVLRRVGHRLGLGLAGKGSLKTVRKSMREKLFARWSSLATLLINNISR